MGSILGRTGLLSLVVRPPEGLEVSSINRKATGDEMTFATAVIQEAFPEYEVVWGRKVG